MITAMKGDISGLDFDIIVNPANTQLLPGGGVNKKIFERAGKGLLQELMALPEQKAGSAILSGSYNLPCQALIHAVGPVYNLGRDEEEDLLASCYWNSMRLAYDYLRKNNLNRLTLAFPPISTGPYGFPRKEACEIGVNTIRNLYSRYPDAKVISVVFVCEEQQDYELYKEEIRKERSV